MRKDKRTGVYYAFVPSAVAGHQGRYVTTGSKDRKLAKQIEDRWRTEAHRQLTLGEQPRWLYDELMDWYLEEISPKKKSHWRDLQIAVLLDDAFSGKILADCSTADADEYVLSRRSQGVSDGTIRRELSLLSTALNQARKHPARWPGWNIVNFVSGMMPPPGDERIRFLRRPWEDRKLLRFNKLPHYQDLTILGLNTGMRKTEMLGCRLDQLDIRNRAIQLTPGNQKNNRYGVVPLNDVALAAVERRLKFIETNCPDAKYLFANAAGKRIGSINKGYKAMTRRAGIEDFQIHDLRHTFASWMVQDGEALMVIKDAMRHRDIKSTMKYAHLRNSDVIDAVDRFEKQNFLNK